MEYTPYHPRGDGVYSISDVQHAVHNFEQRFDEAANRHNQQHQRNQPIRSDFNQYTHHQPRGEQHQWHHHVISHDYDASTIGGFVPFTPPPIAPEEEKEDCRFFSMQHTLQRIIDAQTKIFNDLNLLNARVDSMYLDLNSKFQSLYTHVMKLDLQVTQIAQAISEAEIRNKVVSTHELVGDEDLQTPIKELHHDVQEACNTRKKGDQVIPHTSPEITEEIQVAENQVSSRIRFSENLLRPTTTKPRTEAQTHPQPNEDVNIRALEDSKEEASTHALTLHSGEAQPRILTKQKDPGKFLFPCSINGTDFIDSLCDSGSCVNIMPRWIANLLEFSDIRPPDLELVLGDQSTKEPEGVIMDVMVKIDNYQTPVDFYVLNLKKGMSNTLVFGRPFMASVGAIIDMPKGRLSFVYVDKGISYPSIQATSGEYLAVSTKKGPDKKVINKINQPQKVKQSLKAKGEPKPAMNPPETTKEKAPPDPHQKPRGGVKPRKHRSTIRISDSKITILVPTKSGGTPDEQTKEKLQKTLQLFPGAMVREIEIKDPGGSHGEVKAVTTGDGESNHPPCPTQA